MHNDDSATSMHFLNLYTETSVVAKYQRANSQYTLIKSSGTDPVTGAIHPGLDLFGRIEELRWESMGIGIDASRVDYGYNRASSRIWRANRSSTGDYDWLYNYDGLQRVAGGTRGTLNSTETAITDPTFGQCWTLDSTGNWQGFRQDDTGGGTWSLEQTRTASSVNEITAITNTVGGSWATPVYDPAGNMTTVPNPVPTSGSSLTGTYDAWNRLVKLTDDATDETIQQYQYDGRNYRTVVQSYTSGSLSETRHAYFTDNWQCVEERLGTSPDASDPDRHFVWGVRYIDDLICRDRSVSGILSERLYACQDANWNMTAVVDGGNVAERYEYDPYGNCTFLSPTYTVQTSSSYVWETLYAGYHWDGDIGVYAVRNRFFSPHLGLWITRDPMAYQGGMNQFSYVTENPLSFTDPYGYDRYSDAGELYPEQLEGLKDMAELSSAAYQDPKHRSDVLPELSKRMCAQGWTPTLVRSDADSGFRAVLFTQKGTGKAVLAFAGTVDSPDWKANVQQNFSIFQSKQYDQGIALASQLKSKYGSNLELTGHSLGGGIATAASIALSSPGPSLNATTFNAAAVNPNTVERLGGALDDATDTVTAIRAKGDPLSQLQSPNTIFAPGFGVTGQLFSKNVGETYWINGASHGMGDVMLGLQSERNKYDDNLQKKPSNNCGRYGAR